MKKRMISMLVMVAMILTAIPMATITAGAENLNALQLLEAKENATPMEFGVRNEVSAGSYDNGRIFYVFDIEEHSGSVSFNYSFQYNTVSYNIYNDKGVKLEDGAVLDIGTYYFGIIYNFSGPLQIVAFNFLPTFEKVCLWGTPNITKAVTCDENGVQVRTCTICGETDIEQIPMLEHKNIGAWNTVQPTCTKDGGRVRDCNDCTHKEQEITKATGFGGEGLCITCGVDSRKLGDITGTGKVEIGDALEILKYLAGMNSMVVESNACRWEAARITKNAKPQIGDALEILKFLAGMTSMIK